MNRLSATIFRYKPVHYRKVFIVALVIFAFSRPATGLGLEIQQAQINRWYDIGTPAGPVDRSEMPKMLRSQVRKSEPFVSIYRFQLQKGRKYTFQTEYPADYLTGSACLRGVNPLAESDVYNAPSGTTALILCKHRGFPGGNIKGHVFGRKSNFTVSSKSQHDSAYLVISSEKPNTPFRFRMIDPAENDDHIRKNGGYQLRPDRDPYYSWSNVYKKHFWLGYARGEEKKGQPVIVKAAPPAASTAAADLNGQEELLDRKGKPYVWIEAENDKAHRVATRASARHSSYPHSGTAYWYLATGSDWVEYDVTISQAGPYYIWIRDFDDQKHDPALRSVNVSVDGRALATIPAHTRQGNSLWAWNKAGAAHLDQGRHTLKIAKARTTRAAALIDVIYITSDGAALPPAVKETTADRPKPMESTAGPDCRAQAKAFLQAVGSKNYQQARAAMTGEFQSLADNQDLVRFRRSLMDFGQYQTVSETCTRESGDISEAVLVLQNNRGQTIMVQFAFINDRIDQCIARWGVQ